MLHGCVRYVCCYVKKKASLAIFLDMVVILLLNVMELLSVGEVLCWIDHVWSSKECVVSVCVLYVFAFLMFFLIFACYVVG